jgi:hypothetical protein
MEDHLCHPDPRTPGVESVVLAHLDSSPGFKRWDLQHSTFQRTWAEHLVEADVDAFRHLGVSQDAEEIEEIVRMACNLISALTRLSPSSQRWIEYAKVIGPDKRLNKGPHGYTPVLGSVKAELDRLDEVLRRYAKSLRGRPVASKKRNWRAASVAQAARTVWAIAFWNGDNPGGFTDKQREEYRRHLEEFAPRTAKDDEPGPFGRFLEAVNLALGILKASGDPVSARTALDSLRSLQASMSRENPK